MALKKCTECGRDVSTKAKSCPNCGAVVKTGPGCLAAATILIIVLVIGQFLEGTDTNGDDANPSRSEATDTNGRDASPRGDANPVAKAQDLIAEIKAAQGEEREVKLERLLSLSPNTKEFPEELSAIREKIKQREEEARSKRESERQAEIERKEQVREEQARLATEAMLAEFKWRYQVTKDDLTSKPTYLAGVKSVNQVNFDFPYQEAQRGQLMLRTHPQYGKDLILRVERGQMLVRSYEDTTVKVVFDGGAPVTYKVVGPEDHGTTSLFFRDYHGFVGRMLKAKNVKISVPFYQQGNVVFEFNVSDFDSERYLDKN